jgi:hypothetical protein
MYFGRDQNWYATTPGDYWYQSPRNIGDDTAYHVYSTDIYKLIAFVQWSIRSTRVFDCSYINLDVGMVYKMPDYQGSGFQTIVNNILSVTQIGDITQQDGGIAIRFGGTFYGFAGSPCDNPSSSDYDCTWTISQGSTWDDFPDCQHKYDIDNNRYADQDNTYSHTDMPWDPLVDVS